MTLRWLPVAFALIACGKLDKATKDTSAIVGGLPNPSATNGQFLLNLKPGSDAENVDGYVVGSESSLKLKKTSDGQFYIDNVPVGEHDVIVTAEVSKSSENSEHSGKKLGKRFSGLKFTAGANTVQENIEIPVVGSITGVAKRSKSADHAGIRVYIPGTSFQATTDSSGSYSISPFVPVGINNLYFESDGYHRAQVEKINTESDKATKLPEVQLHLSTGASGFLIINNGSAVTDNQTVSLSIGATKDTVLMKVSEDPLFTNLEWTPINAQISWTFSSPGPKTLYVKFADSNGLESSAFSQSILVDLFSSSGGISLVGGDVQTSRSVAVGIDSPTSANEMMVSNNSGFSGASWIPASNTFLFTALDDGQITLYLKFRNSAGFESAVMSKTFTIDTLAPGIVVSEFRNVSESQFVVHVETTEQTKLSVQVAGVGQFESGFSKIHDVIVNNLTAGTLYQLSASVVDVSGKSTTISSISNAGLSIRTPRKIASKLVSGNVVWLKSESPLFVDGNVLVDTGATLTVEPGVRVLIGGNFSIRVLGTLVADGTQNDPIVFEHFSLNPVEKSLWKGVKFEPSSVTSYVSGGYSGGSIIDCVRFRNAQRGVYIYSTNTLVQNSLFENNDVSIEIRSVDGATIQNNRFQANNYGIFAAYEDYVSGDPVGNQKNISVKSNEFFENMNGVYININQRIVEQLNIVNNQFSRNQNALQIGGGGYGFHAKGVFITSNYFFGDDVALNLEQMYSNLLSPYSIDIQKNVVDSPKQFFVRVGHGQTSTRLMNNIFSGGSGRSSLSSTVNFLHNSFLDITGIRLNSDNSNFYYPSNWVFSGNTFLRTKEKAIDIGSYGSGHQIIDNNFISPASFIVYNNNPNAVVATGNYLGSIATQELAELNTNLSQIFDKNDDVDFGVVSITGYQTTPRTSAPIASPSNLQATVTQSGDVVLSWSVCAGQNVSGIKVYWDVMHGFNYQNSQSFGLTNTVTLSGVNSNIMKAFAVTCISSSYDETLEDSGTLTKDNQVLGNESWYARVSL